MADRSGHGLGQAEVERAAALKNAELTAGKVPTPQQLAFSLPVAAGDDIDRRFFVANTAALLGSLLELGQGLPLGQLLPTLAAPTIDVPAQSLKPVTSVAKLRQKFVDHHEYVLASALTTVKRYSSVTRHLVSFAEQDGVLDAANISARMFTRYLCNIEVAANGHRNASHRRLSEKSISFTLQTCGGMCRFGVENGLLPKGLDNPFHLRGLCKLKMRCAKSIFVFDAPTELEFFRAADPWSFAIHFTLAKTGLRLGELVHTLIEDLDFEDGWLHVRAKPELGWNVKTGTDRDVPLAPEVVQVLRAAIGDRVAGPVFRRMKIASNNPPDLNGDRAYLTRITASRLEQRRNDLGRKLTRREEAAVQHSVWRDAGAVRADRIRNSLIRVAQDTNIEPTCPDCGGPMQFESFHRVRPPPLTDWKESQHATTNSF